MKKSLVILALVAGCGASDHGNNQAATPAPGQGSATAALVAAPAPTRVSDAPGLAGLSQSGNPAHPNQLCIADQADSTQFGLTVWGPNMAACSAAALAKAAGGTLTLPMPG